MPGGGTPSGSDSCIPWDNAVAYGSMKDPRDNKTYRTVQVAGKNRMAENLAYATAKGSWVYHGNADTCARHGRLDSWAAAKGLPDTCVSKA